MTCIIKSKDGYFKIYFIALQQNSIVGWFAGDWMRRELGIPDDATFEIHFTFPKDGNFHHTILLKNNATEEFINVYWNKVKIKVIDKESGTKTIEEKTREEFKDNLLGHLVPLFKPDSLEKVETFHFPTMSFNVFNGSFKVIKNVDLLVEEKDIRNGDLVIDVSGMESVSLNISAAIRPLGEVLTLPDPSQFHYKYYALGAYRELQLRCMINPFLQ
jgi:hypothetical protein